MIKKKKNKAVFTIRDYPYNNKKIFRYKAKKWVRIFFNFQKRYVKFRFLRKRRKYFNIATFYRFTLNFKRKLVLFYGPLRRRTLARLVKENKYPTLVQKKKLRDTRVINPVRKSYSRRRDIIHQFEAILALVLVRLNLYKTIRESYKAILKGHIFVNNYLVKSPVHILKPGDAIRLGGNLKPSYRLNLRNYKSRHLWISYKQRTVLYHKYPEIRRLEFPSFVQWSFLYYINKLKRK